MHIYMMYMIYDVDSNWQLDWMRESKMFGENELTAGLVTNVKQQQQQQQQPTTTTTTTNHNNNATNRCSSFLNQLLFYWEYVRSMRIHT